MPFIESDPGNDLKSKGNSPQSATTNDMGSSSEEHEQAQGFLRGPRLHFSTAALCICLFLTNLEVPIVTTALFGITQDLGGFSKASWVISTYLLGYVGVIIIYAKLSDIFGRKSFLLLALLTFVIFSGACGAAQTIDELIVFRALQGIGGAGIFAMCTIILLESVPSSKYAKYTSSISVVYSVALLLGPILAGAITQSTTWRWIFLLNVPAGAVAAVMIVFSLPNGFPNHKIVSQDKSKSEPTAPKQKIQRVDGLGAMLLLVATVLLVAALQEAGLNYPWKSAFIISLLTVSGICWILFIFWEHRVTLYDKIKEPVFPWRFFQSRIWVGMIMSTLFFGGPWLGAMFQLPQRLQIVNVVSPLEAGERLIPFTLAAPIGSIVAPVIAKAGKVPPIYLVLTAAILQVIGFALLSTLPNSLPVRPEQYGYEIIAGFGCGISITLLILMTPFSVEERDKAVAIGSIAQFRVMGGAIGLAIITTAFNSLITSRLGEFLSESQLIQLLKAPTTITSLSQDRQEVVRLTFADGYKLQLRILCGLAAGQIPASLLMWQKQQITV